MAINQIANLGVKVDPRGAVTGANKAKRAITGIGKSARDVKNRIMSMQGALLGLGAGALVKSIITTASEVESLQVRLKFLTGSAEDSAKAFETMTKFASQVPFSLEDIERASPLLLTVADDVDQLNELLSITGDIAAVSGLSFEATAGQLQRALAGGISAADLFRERGVKAFLGFEEGVQYSAEQTSQHILKLFRDGTTTAKGATEELKDTYQGQVSMMSDAFRELKLVVADAGVFEATSNAVLKITEAFKDEKTKEAMRDFGTAITTIGTGVGNLIGHFLGLPEWVRNTGIVLAFLGGKRALFVVASLNAIAFAIDRILESVEELDATTSKMDKDAFGMTEGFTMLDKNGKRGQDAVRGVKNAFKDLDETLQTASGEVDRFGIKASLDESNEVLDKIINKVVTLDDVFSRFDQPLFFDTSGDEVFSYAKNLEILHKGYKDVVIEATKLPIIIDSIGNHMDKNSIQAVAMAEKIRKINEAVADAQEKQQEFADGLATTIEDSIMKMTQGLMTFKDVVKSIFRQVASEMIKYNIARPLASSLSSIVANMFGGAITGTSGVSTSSKPLARANGGNVNAGQPYMVGERGAELFVPKSSGDIVPNNQIGGSTVINVTYSPQVNALDPRTAGTVIVENAPTIVGVVRQAFERNGQQVLI